jgi:PIN domain nuclease of toxin-antitoxin system
MMTGVTQTVYVLDACALLAFLGREPGATVVDNLLIDPHNLCVAHAINLCEVYYDMLRRYDEQIANQAINDLQTAGVQTQEIMDLVFWQRVGKLKVNPGKLSLADCFALALTYQLNATLVTADHHEFDRIDAMGLCPILFIR